ncbi:hypothetical protein GCM10020001_060480 [Nonomuraea salmonea]
MVRCSSLSPPHPGAARVGVDAHPLDDRGFGRATPQQRPHSGEQLGEAERFRHVVVGAGVEADDGVDLVDTCREYQDRSAVAFGADPAGDLEAVHLRQAKVENNEVDAARKGPLKRLRTIGTHLDLIALAAQGARERLGNRGVILGEKNAGHKAIVGP